MVLVIVPTLALARLPGFELHWVWYLSVASVYVQLALSLWLLRRELTQRLHFDEAAPMAAAAAAGA
jgi:hypothetical protein